MKFLLIGDFSGQFSKELEISLSKEKFDAVLCTGDFADMREISKLFKTYGNKLGKVLGKEKNEEIKIEAITKAKIPLEKLNSLGKPIYTVRGNNEYNSKLNVFLKITKDYKNIKLVDFKKVKINGITIIGFPAFSAIEDKKELKNSYEKFTKIIKNIEKTIILSHIPPYNCEFDKIPEKAKNFNAGKHVGYKTVEKIVEKYEFPLLICGHFEEYQGICYKDKTKVINPGAAEQNKYAILEINKNNLRDSKIVFKKV